jgi:hypothetical protein
MVLRGTTAQVTAADGMEAGIVFAAECGGEASCGWEEMGSGFLKRGVH